MTVALLTPFTTDLAAAVGPRTFRKQLLRNATINYKGQKLDFTPPYMSTLAAAFNEGAYDTVKFQLATDDNKHTDDPERMRGTLKAVEVTPDGLDGIIEFATDDAAQLVRDHPDLGVSLRIIPGLEKADGRKYPAAIKHVLGTIDPVVTGMRPWQAVDLAEDNTDSDVDLTSATFELEEPIVAELTDAQKARLDKLLGLPDEQFDTLIAEPTPITDDGKRPGLLARLRGKTEPTTDEPELTEAELEALAADAEAHANSQPTEPVGLSAEAQAAIDLAQATSQQAIAGQLDLAGRLAKSEWEKHRAELVRAGVPPVILDLAAPVLELPAGVIDLSTAPDGTPDPIETLRKVIDSCKGVVDLSVRGEIPEEAENAEKQAAAVARQFRDEVGFAKPATAATSKES